jgi:type II secretory pathway predicted ATPase ExeA
VASAVHLPAMDGPGVRSYIRHRLAVSAGPDPAAQAAAADIFGISACDLIYEVTAGVPRLVNQLADLAMVYAFSKGQKRVLRLTVQQVLDDGVFFAARLPPAAPASPAGEGT